MPHIKFRTAWTSKGVKYRKGDVLEVSDDQADNLCLAQGRAVRIDPPQPAAVEPEATPAPAEEADQASEDQPEPYKPGSTKAKARK